MKSTNLFKKTIKAYLDKRAKEDELFSKTYAKENKTIDDCITYILNTVKESGCNGFADGEIYSMAVHYYDEDEIKVGNPITTQVVVNHKVELTDEEIEATKEEAKQQIIREEKDRLKKKKDQSKKERRNTGSHSAKPILAMKPRTKIQKRIVALSDGYFCHTWPSSDVINWVEKKMIKYPAYATSKNVVTCLSCKEKFKLDRKRKSAICPCCGRKINIQYARVQKNTDEFYFSELLVIKEFQVVRTWLCVASFSPNETFRINYLELNRVFVSNQHKYNHAISVSTRLDGAPAFSTPLEYRNRVFNPNVRGVYPQSKIHPYYKKRGFRASLFNGKYKTDTLSILNLLEYDSKVETLIKARYDRLLLSCQYYNSFWDSVKIAIRNNYHAYDWGIWGDHIELLYHQGKDIRNAHYVCPSNLKEEHQKAIDRQRKMDEKRARQREKEKMLQDEEDKKEYKKKKAKFFGLVIANESIEITPLKSIEEFKIESDTLHHCVFDSRYYSRDDSLILSAKVNGKRTETIEYRIDKGEVEQCRGLQNNSSEHHEEILSLFKKNIKKLKAIV